MATRFLRPSRLLIAALFCAAPVAYALDDFAFAPAVPIALPPGGNPWKLRAVDLTGDGLSDPVIVDVIGTDLLVLVAQGGASFSAPVVSPVGPIWELEFADIDHDGRVDLVQIDDLIAPNLVVHLGDGQGGFGPAVQTLPITSGSVGNVCLLDANEDGDLDAVLVQGTKLRTCLGDGTGVFAPPGPPSSVQPLGLGRAHVLDVNRDGHLDLIGVAAGLFSGGWSDVLGDGTGAFFSSQYAVNTFDGDIHGSALGDFDGDQITDFVLSCEDLGNPGPEIALAQGTGSEMVSPVPSEIDVPAASGIRAGDLDADGLDDIVGFAIHNGTSQIWLLHSQGGFTFAHPQFVPGAAPFGMLDVALADLDQDGLLDVVVMHTSSLSILINDAPPRGWKDFGQGLAGVTGVPSLAGAGPLTPGGALTMHLSSAAPSAPAILVVGMSLLALPFKGGVLVPQPHALVPLVTDGAGDIALHGTWPGAATAGFTVWFQAWIADASGPAGYSASNALAAKTQ